jgi:hypothetical protein
VLVLVPLLVKVLLLIASNANVGAGCQLAVGACKASLCDVLAERTFFTHVVTLYMQVFGHFGSDFKFLFEKSKLDCIKEI